MSLRIGRHIGRQSDGRGSLPRGVDASWSNLVNKAEKLRLSSGGIANQKSVDLRPKPTPLKSIELLLGPSEQLTEKSKFGLFQSKQRRSKRGY